MSDLGYIYLSLDELNKMSLTHLISGVDENEPMLSADVAIMTSITGYTEWINEGKAITIGWDWQMLASESAAKLVRVSLPSSNLMLQSDANNLGHQATAQMLGAFIDRFPWQAETLRYVGVSHAA
jgi:hypothetical protein